MLPKRRAGQVSSAPWWTRGTDVSQASQTVDVPAGPAWPGPAAAPCAATPRPACGMSWFWTLQVGLKYEVDCSCFRRDVQESFVRHLGWHEGQMLPRQAKPLTSFPTRPGLAPPLRRALPCPDPPGVFPGFGLGRLMVHSVCVVHLGLTTGFGSGQHRVCLPAEQLCQMPSCCLILVLSVLGKPFSKPWRAATPFNRTVARQGQGSQREWLREFPDMPCMKRVYRDK